VVRALFATLSRAELLERLETAGVAFAPIARPQDLLDDPHLNANGALVDLTLPDGRAIRLPALPIEIDGTLPGVRHDLPLPGEDSTDILRQFGFDDGEIGTLLAAHVVVASQAQGAS
jgi:crotonobetainyl-CoA:carnitine CoA-transferase CaiB-like acyl-CoA transferase